MLREQTVSHLSFYSCSPSLRSHRHWPTTAELPLAEGHRGTIPHLLDDFPGYLFPETHGLYHKVIWKVIRRIHNHMCRDMGKPDFCICENKDGEQLRSNREADQHLYFCYTDSTIPLLPKSEISSS